MQPGFDEQDDEQEDDPALRERFEAAMHGAEDAGRHCGLYLTHADAAVTGDGQALVLAQFHVGELAFSTRVLDPEVEDEAKVVRGMEVDNTLDEFNRIARDARERTGALAELEEEE